MLEETHIAGEEPDAELVYALRCRAMQGATLDELMDLISPGEYQEFRIACYLKMAFGVPIPLLKELAGEVAIRKSYASSELGESAGKVRNAISATRAVWSARIPGAPGGAQRTGG